MTQKLKTNSLDPLVKRQFWVRSSLYNKALQVCPNKGDISDLLREGLEIALQNRIEKIRKLELDPAVQAIPEKASA